MRAVKTNKTRNFIILFFSLFLTLSVFSQINAANPKPSFNVGLEKANKADWLYLKTNNDLSAYLGKKSSNLPTVRYQKGDNYLEFSMNGVSSTTSVSLETNIKEPNTPTLFYRSIFDGADANYRITNIPFRVKEEIVLNNTPAAPEHSYGGRSSENLTYTFSANTNAKPAKQQDGSVAFFDGAGKYLFQLDKPFMIDAKGNRSEEVTMEIKPLKITKNTPEGMFFGDISLKRNRGLPPDNNHYNGAKNFVNILVNIKNVLDLGGIEPPKSLVATRDSLQAMPRTKLLYQNKIQSLNIQYQIILKADSNWLSAASYPVIIDPTITHNADSNFSGQMNRIADSDTTTNTQLESSYPEATKDPHTVLLLHFNEANGTTAGIRDYASTTRVITANGNASTTNATTQLGMGNSGAFDGTSDYFSMPDSDDWNFGSGDFSIEFWVKRAGGVGSTQYIMGQAQNGVQDDFFISFTAGNAIFVSSQKVGGGTTNLTTANTITDTSYWHHIVALRKSDRLMVYIDGVADTTTTDLTGITLLNSSRTFHVGTMDTYSTGLNGYLDSLRILKGRALTPEEIKAAASRRPYAVYTSSVLDASASVAWNTLNWTEGGVNTGNGEQPYYTNSLVAQWDFNDTSGATLTASSSGSCTTSCNGTLTNFAYTSSQDQATTTTGWTANNKRWGAGALMMESAAAADYVSISDPASNVLDPNSADLTIETWIKTNDISAEIFSNNNANGTTCTNNGYYLGIDANGYPVFYLDTNGATAGCDASTTSQFKINDGNWHKVAVSVIRGASAVIYVDGKSAGSDTSVTSYSAITVTGNAYFGGSAGGLDAILDSARIYSRALSASEILSNYQAGNIEIQTRTGATSDPNDGTWEAWKPTTGETQLLSMDSDAANWRSDIMASTTIATSTDTTIKMEGTGSLKVKMGMASTTAGTVALWHFEETGTTTGTTLYDSTANANNATTTGTTVVDGIFGKARKFNGTSDYVSAADSNNWNFGTGDYAIDFWLNTNSTAEGEVFHQTIDVNNRVLFRVAPATSNIWYGVQSGGVLLVDINPTTVPLSTNTWYHFAIVRNGSNVNVYKNGVSVGSHSGNYTHPDLATNLFIGSTGGSSNNFSGIIDEFRILNGRALSPDEIAETYRMGANHHLTRQVSATDMSSANKLAFNVAADRPGTYLETMLGESDYANYELASSTLALSTATVLYIKGDEIASSTSIKDSSFSGKAITANGNARTSGNGKIGNSVYFDGTGDYLSADSSTDFNFATGDFAIDFWVKFNTVSSPPFMGYVGGSGEAWYMSQASGNLLMDYFNGSVWTNVITAAWTPSTGAWYHVSTTRSSGAVNAYVNGTRVGSSTFNTTISNGTRTFGVGAGGGGVMSDGFMDEVRVIKGSTLTADQIRQAYEYGLRSHQITIDFGATLQPSDLISNSTDYNFSITATTSGLSATTSGLYLGDKIVVKENLGGTEYTAQGTVNAINTTTGAITVPSWDTGSTFPASNGYSPNATVFKWQKEYFDLTGAATTTRNAITNLTLRPTNGAGGRTVYLDDFRYNTNYLTASSSSAITSSNGRYLQYRAIFSSWDSFVSPFMSAISVAYTSAANMFGPIMGVSGGGFLSF